MNSCPHCKAPATDAKRFLCGSRVKVTGTFERKCEPTNTEDSLLARIAELEVTLARVIEWADSGVVSYRSPELHKILSSTPAPIAVRESVQWFAQQMEAKLKENDHKGGWGECSFDYLLTRLKEEVQELLSVDTDAEAVLEAADIANFAMMLADLCSHRHHGPAKTDSVTPDSGDKET